MRKIIALSLLCTFALSKEPVELVAENFNYSDDNQTIEATGNAVAISDGNILKADRIIYQKNNATLEAYGDISLVRSDSSYILSDYAKIQTDTKNGSFSQIYYFDKTSGLWMSGQDGKFSPLKYTFLNGEASGCNPANPTWTLRFSTANYYKSIEFVTMYNPRIYIKDTPVFYMPFFAFHTDKSRHSGLLAPKMGLAKNEGFIYQQPIYLAPAKNWDLELTPQIRTERGQGLSEEFRFADSPNSKGKIQVGWFEDEKDFSLRMQKKQSDNLEYKHSTHIGIKSHYERSHLFSDNNLSHDYLYLDFIHFNDTAYLNLDKIDTTLNVDSLITSKFNYMYEKDLYYAGIYGRYYFDAKKERNNDTIQTLPILHFHRYNDSLVNGWLLYSLDGKIKNWTRDEGVTAQQTEINVPLTLHHSFFDDYLHFSFSENFYMNDVSFHNSTTQYDSYRYYKSSHVATLSTDLIRPYTDFIHALNISFNYNSPAMNNEKSGILKPSDFNYLTTPTNEKKTFGLSIKEYFYNHSGSELFFHRLTQNYLPQNDDSKLDDLENEIGFTYQGVNFSNIARYSHHYHDLSSSTTTLNYQYNEWNGKLSHIFQENRTSSDNNYYSFGLTYAINGIYSLGAEYDYDATQKESRSKTLYLSSKRRCVSWWVKYRQENPLGSAVTNRAIYLQFNLIPLIKIDQKYVMER